jgi:large subunit ribosomal protein L18
MQAIELKRLQRARRKRGIRKRIVGTATCPRLAVFRSLKHIYAQIIDDHNGRTLASASSQQTKLPKSANKAAATAVGTLLAQKAKEAGVVKVAFDRAGFRYHGRVKALADAARKGGLKF